MLGVIYHQEIVGDPLEALHLRGRSGALNAITLVEQLKMMATNPALKGWGWKKAQDEAIAFVLIDNQDAIDIQLKSQGHQSLLTFMEGLNNVKTVSKVGREPVLLSVGEIVSNLVLQERKHIVQYNGVKVSEEEALNKIVGQAFMDSHKQRFVAINKEEVVDVFGDHEHSRRIGQNGREVKKASEHVKGYELAKLASTLKASDPAGKVNPLRTISTHVVTQMEKEGSFANNVLKDAQALTKKYKK